MHYSESNGFLLPINKNLILNEEYISNLINFELEDEPLDYYEIIDPSINCPFNLRYWNQGLKEENN